MVPAMNSELIERCGKREGVAFGDGAFTPAPAIGADSVIRRGSAL
jgi:hypothetical protein